MVQTQESRPHPKPDSRIIPGYEQVADIGETKKEFTISGRVFHEAKFPTDTGRAKMHVVEVPPLLGDASDADDRRTLRLMTMRSEGQFNTVVYEDEDVYRGQERRDVILMNESDLRNMGIAEDDRVDVRSAAGAMRGIIARPFDIPAGNCAMYYPEANVLIPRLADPLSHTPTFKSVAVEVTRAASDASLADGWVAKPHAAGSSRELKAC